MNRSGAIHRHRQQVMGNLDRIINPLDGDPQANREMTDGG